MSNAIRLRRIIGLMLVALALCGCSAVKLAYNNFDHAAYWWLDGMLDFSDAQSPRVREDLDRLHRWHRGAELPRYADLLARLEQLAPGDVTPQQACAVVDEARERLAAVSAQAEPAAVTLALTLTQDQLDHLARRYEKNDAQFRKDWLELSPQERLDKRMKQWVERAETVYGTLHESQRTVLRRQMAQSAFDAERLLGERRRRQRDALDTLGRVAGRPVALEQARTLLRGWVERAQYAPDAAHRAFQESLLQENCRIFSAVHNATTAAQREQAVRRLRAYQRDLRELAAQP